MSRSDPPSATYDDDFYLWTRQQAAALRRAGGCVPPDVDLDHCAEEIEDLGRRDLREATSFLRLLLFHLMKIAAEPGSPSALHWRSEAREFGRSALRAFSPGMRQHIDVDSLWREAEERIRDDRTDAGQPLIGFGPCPFLLEDLLATPLDIDAALARLRLP